MSDVYIPEFESTYLEDSYFLGAYVEGDCLRLKVLFALTTDHADYTSPPPGEAHCYLEGSIVLEQPSIVEWLPRKPTVTQDPDGTLDFGNIELHRLTGSRYRLITDWFDATFEVAHLHLDLAHPNGR